MRVLVIQLRCLSVDLDRQSVPHSNVRRNTDTAGSGGTCIPSLFSRFVNTLLIFWENRGGESHFHLHLIASDYVPVPLCCQAFSCWLSRGGLRIHSHREYLLCFPLHPRRGKCHRSTQLPRSIRAATVTIGVPLPSPPGCSLYAVINLSAVTKLHHSSLK